MFFTLIFNISDESEGPSLAYDLCFHPCPVWFKNGIKVLVPDGLPSYSRGHLKLLLERERNTFSEYRYKTVKVLVHNAGHGSEDDLKCLLEDIEAEGFEFELVS